MERDSVCCVGRISIHALRAEGDAGVSLFAVLHPISIHALRAEGDTLLVFAPLSWSAFLSTPSVRRATPSRCVALTGRFLISIHALRAEGDLNR